MKPEITIVPKEKNEAVAIVGTSATTREQTPFGKPGLDIWALGACYDWIPPESKIGVNAWFEIHRANKLPENVFIELGKIPSLYGSELYIQAPNPHCPEAKLFPIGEVHEYFGNDFSNTISYMIALAILRGYKRIEIYGVDMAADTEYAYQRPNCFKMIGWACGAGIEIYVPKESALARTTRMAYAFADEDPIIHLCRARVKLCESKIEEHRASEQSQHDVKCQYEGAKQMAEYILQFMGVP